MTTRRRHLPEKGRTMKRIIIILSTGLVGLMHPTASHAALDFTFSFTNTFGSVNGTVTGEIDGLVNGTAVAATNVILTSYPASLLLPSPPLNAFTSVGENAFNVSSDEITRVNFGDRPSQFSLGLETFGGGPSNLFLISGAGPDLAVRSDQFPSFSLIVPPVPEPSSVVLLATGLAALWPLRRLRRRKGSA
jgi:hypothetical protein